MNLVVFFSRGMSLEGWRAAGILERELALYRAMLPSLSRLAFVTYGGAADVDLGKQFIPEAEVLANLDHRSPNRYSLSAVWTHRRALRAATVFKTNQINGAWAAVLAKWMFRVPLVVRCGFLWSQSALTDADGWLRHQVVTRLERRIFRSADRVIVAAAAHRELIIARYGVATDVVQVIPNYVDTARFHPAADVTPEPGRVTFVGRLSPEKNPDLLLDAVNGLQDVTLIMAGDGPMRADIEAAAIRRGVRVEFLGKIPHADLPALLRRSTAFVLPSAYEGNPKALLEAMACGVPVIGTRVRGIREVIVDGENGLLCDPTSISIRSAIQRVLMDPQLRARVATGGVDYVRRTSALGCAVRGELAVLSDASKDVQHV